MDYAQWQRHSLSREELDRQIRYWKTRLSDIPPLFDLPADRARPSSQHFCGREYSVLLPDELSQRLAELAQREGATLFTVLFAAFIVLLYRYSREEDVLVGVPVAGRGLVETEDLIGFFVNTVVVRTSLSGKPRFRDVLAQVRDLLIEGYANQDVPFERVVEELRPERSLAYNPIVQVMASTFPVPRIDGGFGRLTAVPYAISNSTSRFDLTGSAIEGTGGVIWWQWQYNTALFDEERIRRMGGHFIELLNGIAKDPRQRICDLALLTSEEQRQFAVWNETAADYPKLCVHELIARQAARTPERIAVLTDTGQVTYHELQGRVEQVAAALFAAGVRAGARIAICFERSVEMVVGVLAIHHTGAAYVPMDPDYPAERLMFILEDAAIGLILTDSHTALRLPDTAVPRILIEDALRPTPVDFRVETYDPENLAYVMYTSGSTGKPKGVPISHRAVVNLLWSMLEEPGLTADDRFLAVTNLCFDISALELFLPLITGARLIIARREAAVDGGKLLEMIRRHAVTAMQATPMTWQLLIQSGWSRADGGLKVLVMGHDISP